MHILFDVNILIFRCAWGSLIEKEVKTQRQSLAWELIYIYIYIHTILIKSDILADKWRDKGEVDF